MNKKHLPLAAVVALSISMGGAVSAYAADLSPIFDVGVVQAGSSVTIKPLANDGDAEWVSLTLTDDTKMTQVTKLTDDSGTYVVNPDTLEVTFTPASGFTGNGNEISYTGTAKDGATVQSTLQFEVVAPQKNASDPVAYSDGALIKASGGSYEVLRNDQITAINTTWDEIFLIDSNGEEVKEIVGHNGVIRVDGLKLYAEADDHKSGGIIGPVTYRAYDSNGNYADANVEFAVFPDFSEPTPEPEPTPEQPTPTPEPTPVEETPEPEPTPVTEPTPTPVEETPEPMPVEETPESPEPVTEETAPEDVVETPEPEDAVETPEPIDAPESEDDSTEEAPSPVVIPDPVVEDSPEVEETPETEPVVEETPDTENEENAPAPVVSDPETMEPTEPAESPVDTSETVVEEDTSAPVVNDPEDAVEEDSNTVDKDAAPVVEDSITADEEGVGNVTDVNDPEIENAVIVPVMPGDTYAPPVDLAPTPVSEAVPEGQYSFNSEIPSDIIVKDSAELDSSFSAHGNLDVADVDSVDSADLASDTTVEDVTVSDAPAESGAAVFIPTGNTDSFWNLVGLGSAFSIGGLGLIASRRFKKN